MKKILVLLVAVFVAMSAYSNNEKAEKNEKANSAKISEKVNITSISGSIIDNKSNELLAGATIYVDGNKYYSDLDGNFTISKLSPGKHLLRVELISYQPSEIEVDIDNNKNINIVLNQQ